MFFSTGFNQQGLLPSAAHAHCILICAPFGQDAQLTARVLQEAGIASTVCSDSSELLARLQQGADALLLVEEVVTGPALESLTNFIDRQPAWSNLPVLLLSRSGGISREVQQAITKLGDVTLVERPVRALALVTTARSALRSRQRQYQIRDANQRKDEFLATLAHELRNPLAPIRSAMAILGSKKTPDEALDLPALRGIVERQVAHLTRLVDDLLDVARITTGKVELKKSPVTLASVVRHAVEISLESLEAKKHQLVLHPPRQGELWLDADRARLVQSIANLLVNAAKFTPAGGSIEIDTHADVETGWITLEVKDNGIGMTPETLGLVFGLFAQAPVTGQATAGLGIGLSLAQKFAQMHNGSLVASSPGLGLGSTFCMRLPIVLPVSEQEAFKTSRSGSSTTTPVSSGAGPSSCAAMHPGSAPAASAGQPANLPLNILVVDDNTDAADTLEILLGMEGFAVRTVYDGAAAVAAVAASRPDVVVMDIGMPHMDGYEAARQMRQRYPAASLQLIALTGWGQSSDITRAQAAGFDYHLVKPVDYEQLLECIAKNAAQK